jgi:hypothetical protein
MIAWPAIILPAFSCQITNKMESQEIPLFHRLMHINFLSMKKSLYYRRPGVLALSNNSDLRAGVNQQKALGGF